MPLALTDAQLDLVTDVQDAVDFVRAAASAAVPKYLSHRSKRTGKDNQDEQNT
jgi:hypothetical protein